jgi:hypothetical protein
MNAATDDEPGVRPAEVDWSQYVRDVRLVEGTREVGPVPVVVPDTMTLDGFAVEVQRGSWGITCTGNGVATVTASVRAGDVHVARVYIAGQRVLVPPSAIPDVPITPRRWVQVRIYGLDIRVVPAAAW